MRLSCAIFDMDGLMFDTEHLFIRGFEEAIGPRVGYRFTKEGMLQLVGINYQAAKEKFPTLFPGCAANYDACITMFRAWMDEQIRLFGIPVKPGLKELLTFFREEKIPCAVATSSNTSVADQYLSNAGITDYFSKIIGGDQVTRSKPDPQIFQIAMRALGADDPSECVVFEDSRNGLLAGANGGFPVIVVPDVMDPTVDLPGRCYAKCETLRDAIEVIRNS